MTSKAVSEKRAIVLGTLTSDHLYHYDTSSVIISVYGTKLGTLYIIFDYTEPSKLGIVSSSSCSL